jgi:hypothetical protein
VNSRGSTPLEPQDPLRDRIGEILNVDGLRRAGELLARHFGLPHPPHIRVGYVPWKGPTTPIIDCTGGFDGSFTIARWAVRGKYRRSWASLEYALVSAIGFWLESHRKESVFGGKGTSEALRAWYGKDMGGQLAADYERRSRSVGRLMVGVGVALLAYLVLWAAGLVR